MGRLRLETKTGDKSQPGPLKVPVKHPPVEGSARTVKNIYALYPVTSRLAYLE